ncbi:MAG: TIGR02391 family protein [Gemmatimonadales bacterium]
MSKTQLDASLLRKLVEKTGKPLKYVREQISKRAARQGIASEAAQILWAKEYGIGTGVFQRRLDAHVQEQVRAGLPSLFASPTTPPSRDAKRKEARVSRPVSPLRAAIDYLLSDEELKRRCADLLTARGSFDRVFREATTVLDDRLKKLAGIKSKVNPADLVARVLHPSKAILIVSEHADEQEGFYSICKGLFAAFRNPAHHALNDKLTREDALRFCGFMDAMLTILKQARLNLPASS